LQEEIENKTVTLMINSSKLTARTLSTAFSKFLRYTHGKLKEKRAERREVVPHGKQSVQDLIAQNAGVEKAELADKEEVKDFDFYAKRYGVDYAIKKGYTPEGKQRYILFFKARDRSAIDQVMLAYTKHYVKRLGKEHPPAEAALDKAKEMVPGRRKERVREKGHER